ncbi:MAG TPA: hypothetical protein VHX65_12280 [Pirellulales bacterium]|nr:hypothetical protein [Pirellulales bacterium]
MAAAQGYETADWWRALLVFALTIGWRIEEILQFKRDDLDLDTGAIMTRAATNKGKRDDCDYLPPTAIDHLKRLAHFGPMVFFWPHDHRDAMG